MRQFLWATAVLIAATGGQVHADEADCGKDYISKSGETVYQVASKAFGPGLHRQLFVNAMMHRHGQNGGVLTEGTRITIPCAVNGGFELPEDHWTAATDLPVEVTVLTAGHDPAAAGSTHSANSLFIALLEGLMREGLLVGRFAALGPQEIAAHQPFPDDGGPKEVSFPWVKSDCVDAPRRRGALCASALWSDPLFDLTSGVYSVQGGLESLSDVGPGGLCISDESRGAAMQSGLLTPEMLSKASGGSSDDCLATLRANGVAAVIVPDIVAAKDNRQSPHAPQLQKLPGAAFSDTVHAVVDDRNPNARRILKRLNAGLKEIRLSGEWYRIVQAELSEALIN